jgi:alpha-1,4-galacturonosyltransferase
LWKEGDHKNRVLSEVRVATDGSELKDEGVIEQVTTREGQDGGFARNASDEQQKTSRSQQQSSSEVGGFNPFLKSPKFN